MDCATLLHRRKRRLASVRDRGIPFAQSSDGHVQRQVATNSDLPTCRSVFYFAGLDIKQVKIRFGSDRLAIIGSTNKDDLLPVGCEVGALNGRPSLENWLAISVKGPRSLDRES